MIAFRKLSVKPIAQHFCIEIRKNGIYFAFLVSRKHIPDPFSAAAMPNPVVAFFSADSQNIFGTHENARKQQPLGGDARLVIRLGSFKQPEFDKSPSVFIKHSALDLRFFSEKFDKRRANVRNKTGSGTQNPKFGVGNKIYHTEFLPCSVICGKRFCFR